MQLNYPNESNQLIYRPMSPADIHQDVSSEAHVSEPDLQTAASQALGLSETSDGRIRPWLQLKQ
jgi:hypothetical protein